MQIFDFLIHIDKYLEVLISDYGNYIYLIIFGIVFCETGFVFLPFLPGDSLIFAVGAFAGAGILDIWMLFFLLSSAAIVGDSVNYSIGKYFGNKIINYKKVKLVKEEHLTKAEAFIKKHGTKAVIFARFMPIIRTIVPFVVGMGKLEYNKFLKANIIGGLSWVTIFLTIGYFFGNMDFVKNNFSIIVLGIIFVSVLPVLFGLIKSQVSKKKTAE